MRIQLHFAAIFQHRYGTKTDKIIQSMQRTVNDSLVVIPGSPLLQDGFEDLCEKKRLLIFGGIEMPQQVTMMCVIRRQNILEHQFEDRFCLCHICKRWC